MNVYPLLVGAGNVPYVESYVTDLVALAPVPVHPVVDGILPLFAFAVTVYVSGVHTAYKLTVTAIPSVILEVA